MGCVGNARANHDIERVLRAHAAALARLAASYEARPALREELLQDIAFALWRALPSFRHEASEKTFVMRIATNRCLNALRDSGRRRALMLDAEAGGLTDPPEPSRRSEPSRGTSAFSSLANAKPLFDSAK